MDNMDTLVWIRDIWVVSQRSGIMHAYFGDARVACFRSRFPIGG